MLQYILTLFIGGLACTLVVAVFSLISGNVDQFLSNMDLLFTSILKPGPILFISFIIILIVAVLTK